MPSAFALRRTVPPVALRLLVLAAAVAAALLGFRAGSGGVGPMERSSFRGGAGYWLLAKDGGVFAFGDARFFGPNRNQGQDIAGMAATATGNGYWTVDDDGDVFAYGDAVDYGSRPGPEIDNITGFAARAQGDGYWMVARDGSVYAFGAAAYFGSANTLPLARPIVGMAATPSGKGYWLIAGDGGVFAYGDARFFGSTGNIRLARPIVDFAPSPDGQGYRFIGSDGGVFAYGSAGFFGSTGAIRLNKPVVGFAGTASGKGYWLVGEDGGVFAFGDATFHGSTGALTLNAPIVAIVATPKVKVNPTARPDSATVAEDSSVTIDVQANDTRLLPATVSVESAPAQGTAAVSGGRIVYTPKANYNGSDSFTYRLTDSDGHSDTATVTVAVTAVNDAPTISDVADQTTNEDTPTGAISFTVADIDSATLAISAGSSNTTLVPNANLVLGGSGGARTVTATPAPNQNGTTTITLTVSDGSLSTSDTFVLTVTPVNDALPVATDGSGTTDEDTAFHGSLAATDVDGDTLTFAVVGGPSNGSVVVDAGGSFTYTPDADFFGSDSFTFKANDGTGDSDPATFTITVDPVNDAPVAQTGSATTPVATPLGGSVVATDVEGDTLTYSLVSGPSNGALILNADGTFTYTPGLIFHGTDSFQFKANDGEADSNTATFTITVNGAPVAVDDSGTTVSGTAVVNVLANDFDPDDPQISLIVTADVSVTANLGTVVCALGECTYVADVGFHGTDTFTYTLTDPFGASDTGMVTITVP